MFPRYIQWMPRKSFNVIQMNLHGCPSRYPLSSILLRSCSLTNRRNSVMAMAREDRVLAVDQLREEHALVLECFPEIACLLPDPLGLNMTHSYWGVCIQRARRLLHALGHHDAEELRATTINFFEALLRHEPLLHDLLPHRLASDESFMCCHSCVLITKEDCDVHLHGRLRALHRCPLVLRGHTVP